MGVFLEIDSDTTHRFFFVLCNVSDIFSLFSFLFVFHSAERELLFVQLKVGPQEGLLVPMVVASSVPMVCGQFCGAGGGQFGPQVVPVLVHTCRVPTDLGRGGYYFGLMGHRSVSKKAVTGFLSPTSIRSRQSTSCCH